MKNSQVNNFQAYETCVLLKECSPMREKTSVLVEPINIEMNNSTFNDNDYNSTIGST